MQLNPDIFSLINSLELQRAAELKKFGSIALVVLFVFIIFFTKFRSNFLPVLGLGFIVLIGSYYVINNRYKTEVQNRLIPNLLKQIDPSFRYNKDKQIDIDLINSLKFFSHKIENSNSDGSISIQEGNKSAEILFVTLESVNVDTEEGEHETTRFDGAIVAIEFPSSFDQKYLLSSKNSKTPQFEAGDYLNPQKMGLKTVKALIEDFVLYSENGKSLLDESLIKKVLNFKDDLKIDSWVIFNKNRVYIFVDGIKDSFDISLFSDLKKQNFMTNYIHLLKRVKILINE